MPNMGGCDDSKCVSKGRSNLHNDSFTCYGDDGTFYPMMCADGYLPLVVEDENDFTSNVTGGVDASIPVSYFTCCPLQHHHFSNGTCERDLLKEEWAISKGLSVVRVLQEDVWNDRLGWDRYVTDKIEAARLGEPRVFTLDAPEYHGDNVWPRSSGSPMTRSPKAMSGHQSTMRERGPESRPAGTIPLGLLERAPRP